MCPQKWTLKTILTDYCMFFNKNIILMNVDPTVSGSTSLYFHMIIKFFLSHITSLCWPESSASDSASLSRKISWWWSSWREARREVWASTCIPSTPCTFIHLFTHSFIHVFFYLCIQLCIYSWLSIYSYIQLCMHSFIRLLKARLVNVYLLVRKVHSQNIFSSFKTMGRSVNL